MFPDLHVTEQEQRLINGTTHHLKREAEYRDYSSQFGV